MNPISSEKSSTFYSYRWLALAVILLPTLLISLNTYMIQIALPSIQNDLHISFSHAQLLFSGYSVGLATALIIGGKLGDIYGRKNIMDWRIVLYPYCFLRRNTFKPIVISWDSICSRLSRSPYSASSFINNPGNFSA